MIGDPRFDHYDWAGGREAMLRFGPETGPVVIAALPLFEEANRTRTFVVAILRALAAQGIGSVLPDMPGQGESLALLETLALVDIQTAFAAAVAQIGGDGRRCYAVTVRSGALLTGSVGDGGYWHLAPQDGPALLRELSRMTTQDGLGRGSTDPAPTLIAGNLLSPAFLADLAIVRSFDAGRIVRLSTDPAPADRKIDGAPLWRRSEPGADGVLAQILADDIADWIATCER